MGAVWTLSPELERRGVCVPFLDAGGRARPVPYVPRNAVVLRSGTTHRARNFELRELTHHDLGASAVHQALYVIQNALQGAASHQCRFEENSLVWVIPAVTHLIEYERPVGISVV